MISYQSNSNVGVFDAQTEKKEDLVETMLSSIRESIRIRSSNPNLSQNVARRHEVYVGNCAQAVKTELLSCFEVEGAYFARLTVDGEWMILMPRCES